MLDLPCLLRHPDGMTSSEDTVPASVRRRRSAVEIRQRLIAAAADAFGASGYAGATTAAIAREAEVTEAQLFRYYPTKADLFREAVFEPLAQHLARFTADPAVVAAEGRTHRAHALDYIAELNDFLERNAAVLRSLLSTQPGGLGEDNRAATTGALRRYFDTGAAVWAERMGKDADADPQMIVRVSFAAVMGTVLFRDWLFPEGMASPAELEAAITEFVLKGIA
jgi:AcrR family transcriptional regulator